MCACTSICFLSLHMPVCKVSNFLGLIFFFSFSIFLLFYVVPNLPPPSLLNPFHFLGRWSQLNALMFLLNSGHSRYFRG